MHVMCCVHEALGVVFVRRWVPEALGVANMRHWVLCT